MRLFVGIALDEPIRAACATCARDLKSRLGSEARALSCPRPESLHLTLKFLGEVDEARVPELTNALAPVAKAHPAFDATVQGTGTFPPHGPPNILWIGVTTGADPMKALAADIDRALHAVGFPLEKRPFSAHLTLARVKDRRAGRAARAAIEAHANDDFGTLAVREFVLYQSKLTPEGAIYTPVASFALRS